LVSEVVVIRSHVVVLLGDVDLGVPAVPCGAGPRARGTQMPAGIESCEIVADLSIELVCRLAWVHLVEVLPGGHAGRVAPACDGVPHELPGVVCGPAVFRAAGFG